LKFSRIVALLQRLVAFLQRQNRALFGAAIAVLADGAPAG
jgi:hypothetical protein